jgi:lysophospholipase L1-like esterase
MSVLILKYRSGEEIRKGDCVLFHGNPWFHESKRDVPRLLFEGLKPDLVVIGDSISSGIDPSFPSWPLVFQQRTGIAMRNLAKPGALSRDGLTMAEKLTNEDHVVLIEIGGNDLLEGVPSEEFSKTLDALLSRVSAPARTVVTFELPLFPHMIMYGRIQRGLVAKCGVWLIPKRFFIEVIGGSNATSDGLHLSDEGTRRMAALAAKALSPVLKQVNSEVLCGEGKEVHEFSAYYPLPGKEEFFNTHA